MDVYCLRFAWISIWSWRKSFYFLSLSVVFFVTTWMCISKLPTLYIYFFLTQWVFSFSVCSRFFFRKWRVNSLLEWKWGSSCPDNHPHFLFLSLPLSLAQDCNCWCVHDSWLNLLVASMFMHFYFYCIFRSSLALTTSKSHHFRTENLLCICHIVLSHFELSHKVNPFCVCVCVDVCKGV